ncbi:sensor histidine kinase [Streptomyces sp. NPDC058171]
MRTTTPLFSTPSTTGPVVRLYGVPLTPARRRLLLAAGLAFVTYRAVSDALTSGAGLIGNPWASVAVAVALCAALPSAGRLPLAVAVLATAGFLLESQVWPVLVALYGVTLRRPPAVALALTGAAYVPAALGPAREWLNMPVLTFLPCAVLVVPLAFGLAAGSHRELARHLAGRLDEAEVLARLRDEQVRLSERARIAREMHDVLAHRLSLLVLHTGVLQRRADEVPEPVRERLALLRDVGAGALDDLRDLLGALRDRESPPPLTPTADDLPGLIEEATAAGTPVRSRVDPLTGLPAAVRLAVHRIVQEALTNARKHAPAQPVELTVVVGPTRVEVRAVNPVLGEADGGRDGGPAPNGPGGYGLIGVAERVTALDGALTARRTDDGRFLLRARLPLGAHPAGDTRKGAAWEPAH